MESLQSLSAAWTTFFLPYPAIFLADLTRYLIAAGGVSLLFGACRVTYLRSRHVRERTPDEHQRRYEIWHSISSAATFAVVGFGIYHGAHTGLFTVYEGEAGYGWIYTALSLLLIIIAHDAYFYWLHRVLHRPRVFLFAHAVHHRSVAPTQWAAYSFSVSEAFLQALFLPLFLLMVPIHKAVLIIWMIHQVVRNAFGHCGVEFVPIRWLDGWWGKWLTTTLHHDLHHSQGRCNFGLYFTWWDRLCKTEHPNYRHELQRLIKRTQNLESSLAFDIRTIEHSGQ